MHCFEGKYTWAKEKMAEKHRANMQSLAAVDNKAEIAPKQKYMDERSLEKELKILEDKISTLEEQLAVVQELDQLQQLYAEKERLEKCWEEIYKQLGD